MQSPLPSDFAEVIDHYAPKIALQFSGGRDSLALLLWMRPFWGKLTVYYCNSGDAYPETLELVNRVRKEVPRFIEIPGRVLQTRATDGLASDITPARASWRFETYAGKLGIVGREVCCYKSIMLPLHAAMRADGIKCIIRGQRDSDEPKSPLKSGEIADGFALYFPIAHWSDQDVEGYIRSEGESVPPYYKAGMTSAPDCMGCTGWLETGSYPYLKRHHPEKAKEVGKNIAWLASQMKRDIQRMLFIAEENHG